MSDVNAADALSNVDLFAGLGRELLGEVAERARVVTHEGGKQFGDQGEGTPGFHLILEGSVTLTVNRGVIRKLGPGQYFGAISLIDGKPRPATITTDTDVSTLSLTSSALAPLLDKEPTLTKALLLAMCERLRAAEALLREMPGAESP
jgi:CRP-like cAMP-binding protein